MSSVSPSTDFEKGFDLILTTFKRYANDKSGGSDDKLEKDEMQKLIKNEFKGYLKLCSPADVDKIFEDFDEDNSESVDFVEFLKIVSKLAADAKILEKLEKLAEINKK